MKVIGTVGKTGIVHTHLFNEVIRKFRDGSDLYYIQIPIG